MSINDSLRTLFSTQGISHPLMQVQLKQRFMKALQLTPTGILEAENVATQQATEAVNEATNNQGAFVTTATLATFPVASGVITVIWKLLEAVVPNAPAIKSPIVPLVLAILLGAYFVYLDLTDSGQAEQPKTRNIIQKCVIGLINSLFLAAAVLGINTAIFH